MLYKLIEVFSICSCLILELHLYPTMVFIDYYGIYQISLLSHELLYRSRKQECQCYGSFGPKSENVSWKVMQTFLRCFCSLIALEYLHSHHNLPLNLCLTLRNFTLCLHVYIVGCVVSNLLRMLSKFLRECETSEPGNRQHSRNEQ